MRKNSAGMKGEGSSIAIAVIVIIVAALVILFMFPGAIGGFSFGGGGGAAIGIGAGTVGVVITAFDVTPPVIEGEDVATFTLTVSNNGGIDADNIQYDIFGLDDSNSWSGASETLDGQSELEHQDPARNIVGEITTQEWESEAQPKNTDITYPVTARVDYDYSTEADVVLIVYGRDNPNVKNTGITQSVISQVAVTEGPLSVTPRGTIPLIGQNTNDFRVSFDIVNVGGGRTHLGNPEDDLDRITINTEGCTLTGDNEVKLINGRRTVSCSVNPSISTDEQETISLNLEIEYSYIVEATRSIRVLRQVEQ